MTDLFSTLSEGLESPAAHLLEITPDDAADIPFVTRALNVATSGTVRVTTRENDTATVMIAAGTSFPVRVKRVWATGTTATGIVGMF